jgi:parvulin-like peptidyl-prolyl isomerase
MRRLLLLLLVPLALLAASCGGGGGSSVGKEDAAVVGGHAIPRGDLDRRMQQARCSYDLQKREFPKAGSPEYQQVQSQILQTLVQRVEFDQEAPKLGVSVSSSKVDDQLKQIKKQYFGGSEKRYQAELKRNCVSDADVRENIRGNLVSDAIYKKLTAGVSVGDAEVKSYYIEHSQVYSQPQTRVVRHILVKDKKLADKLYAQLKNGADFAALAKKYSQDPGSKALGGRLTISKGQTVPEFDKTAFALETGAISTPVHTQFGWHIIQALKPTTPRKRTPFAQIKEQIRQQLVQERRTAKLQTWLNGVKKDYSTKVSYATGLAPAATGTTSSTTTG